MGFSQKTALPASAAAPIRSGTWVSVGAQIATASIAGSPIRRPGLERRHAERPPDLLGQRHHGIGNGGQAGARHAGGQQFGMHPADPARADHADPDGPSLPPVRDGRPPRSRPADSAGRHPLQVIDARLHVGRRVDRSLGSAASAIVVSCSSTYQPA